MMHGIDVSDYQTVSDWSQVRAHAEFCYVQVGYGTAKGVAEPPGAGSRLVGAYEHGLRVGRYFFGYPSPDLATARDQGQAAGEWFRKRWLNYSPTAFDHDLPSMLDLEINPSGMDQSRLAGWVEEWLAATGLPPETLGIYTSPGFWSGALGAWWPSSIRHLWIAAWSAPSAPRPAGLPTPFCWQVSGNGRVPGIIGPVDLDVLLFDPATQPAAPPTPRPTPDLARVATLLREALRLVES